MAPDVVSTITLAGRRYDWQQLLAWEQTQAEPSLSENDRATLQFAREWLSGAQSFALHTSGSTGTPKPIYLARSQMEASARATGAALGLRAGQQALVCLPTRLRRRPHDARPRLRARPGHAGGRTCLRSIRRAAARCSPGLCRVHPAPDADAPGHRPRGAQRLLLRRRHRPLLPLPPPPRRHAGHPPWRRPD